MIWFLQRPIPMNCLTMGLKWVLQITRQVYIYSPLVYITFYMWKYSHCFYHEHSLLYWTSPGSPSFENAWDGWGISGKCWGIEHFFFWMIYWFIHVFSFLSCRSTNQCLSNCAYRQLVRIFLLNQQRPEGLSVLFLMLVL